MKAVEIVDMYFKDFKAFLKTKGLEPERFSMDIWMGRVWEIYYADFINQQKRDKLKQDTVQLFNSEEIMRMHDMRKIIELKNQERMKPQQPVVENKEEVPEQQETEEHKAEMETINEEEKVPPKEVKTKHKGFKLFRKS